MNIEVIVSNDYNNMEMDEMKTLLKEAGYESHIDNTRMVRKSGAEILPAIWFVIGFVSSSVLTGFFNKMGSDAWDKLKEVIIKLYHKKKNHQDPQIRLHVRIGEAKEIIIPMPYNKNDLETSLKSLSGFLEAHKDLDGWVLFDGREWKKLSDMN